MAGSEEILEAGVPEYVIEIPHSPEECPPPGDGAAPWMTYQGCRSGTHTSWTIAALSSDDEAWALVPELLRDTARVVVVDRSDPHAAERSAKGRNVDCS